MGSFRRFSSFFYLNTTQFLVILNDSIFRLIVTYSLIDLLGVEKTNKIVAISAALFVVPFLLISMPSGQMADRFSKKSVIIWTLWAEVAFMVVGFFAILIKDEFCAYFALFLVALQAAVFSPSKYAIIPEIERQDRLSRANGFLTLYAYLAVILGTFLASFISEITHRNYPFVVLLCIGFSIISLLTGYGIENTPIKNPKSRVNPWFLTEIVRSLKMASKYPHLLLAVYAVAFFLYTAAYTQLNLIPFGIQSLGITDVQTGYVYLAAALGIGAGSILVALLSGKTIELGLSIWGAFGVSLSYLLLYVFQFNLTISCILFFSIGMHGGLYVVPLDAYIQYASPEEKRGSIVAASVFLSFLGVLFSAGTIALLGDVFCWSAASGYLWIGFLTLVIAFWILFSLVEYVTRLFAVLSAKFFFTLDLSEETIPQDGIILVKEGGIITLFTLVFCIQKITFLRWAHKKPSPLKMFFYKVFNRIPIELTPSLKIEKKSLTRLKKSVRLGYSLCVIEEDTFNKTAFDGKKMASFLAQELGQPLHLATLKRKNTTQSSFFHFFKIIHPILSVKFKTISIIS